MWGSKSSSSLCTFYPPASHFLASLFLSVIITISSGITIKMVFHRNWFQAHFFLSSSDQGLVGNGAHGYGSSNILFHRPCQYTQSMPSQQPASHSSFSSSSSESWFYLPALLLLRATLLICWNLHFWFLFFLKFKMISSNSGFCLLPTCFYP